MENVRMREREGEGGEIVGLCTNVFCASLRLGEQPVLWDRLAVAVAYLVLYEYVIEEY